MLLRGGSSEIEGIRVGGDACDTINDVEDRVDASDLRVLTMGGICRLGEPLLVHHHHRWWTIM